MVIVSIASIIGCSHTVQNSTSIDRNKNILQRSLKYGDAYTAIESIYEIIETEGPSSTYLDSLGLLYFQIGLFGPSEKVLIEMLNKDSTKIHALEMLAAAQTNLGNTIPAIANYEKLLSKTNNSYHAYLLSKSQYSIRRLAESYLSVQTAESLPIDKNITVQVDMNNRSAETIELEPAIYNLKGAIEFELFSDSLQLAKNSFTKALELKPEFKTAKTNLDFVEGLLSKSKEK